MHEPDRLNPVYVMTTSYEKDHDHNRLQRGVGIYTSDSSSDREKG